MKLGDIVAPLFVPAHRPELFAKAAASAADAIILDLEDAVAAEAKDAARSALKTDFTNKPVLVRINGLGSPWHAADMAAAAILSPAAILLPKAESADDLRKVSGVAPIVALIETVGGVSFANEIAASGLAARIAFGSIDFAADLGCSHSRDALSHARATLLFASKLHGLSLPIDGVTTNFVERGQALADARHARELGFGGKLCIHPSQVEEVLEGFRPTEEEADWARQVLSAGTGAVALRGEMVDEPVRIRALRILDKLRP